MSKRRPEFDLSAQMNVPGCVVLEMPMTIGDGFGAVGFVLLRTALSPRAEKDARRRREEKLVLDELIARLKPFLSNV